MHYDPEAVANFARALGEATAIPSGKIPYLEKDIWLSFALRKLYSLPGASDFLVFKGGTALVKCHFWHYRFSEDLDFTWTGPVKSKKSNRRELEKNFIQPLKEELGFGTEETEFIKGGVRHSHSGKILNYFFTTPAASGREPLKVKLNVSFIEKPAFGTVRMPVKPMNADKATEKELLATYGEVATDYFKPLQATCYSLEEVACEKMRAVLTRKEKLNRSRDIVDLQFLAEKINLEKTASLPQCREKLEAVLANPSWRREFDSRKNNLASFLETLVEYAANEPIYLEALDTKKLSRFCHKTLLPALEKAVNAK